MAVSVHHAILEQVQVDVRALALTGFHSDNIVLQMAPFFNAKEFKNFPGIAISPYGSEQIDPKGGTTASDDIGYPVQVAIVEPHEQEQRTDLEQWLEYREDVIDKFIHNKWPAVAELVQVYDIWIEPGPVFDPTAWDHGWMASVVALRAWYRKQRRVV